MCYPSPGPRCSSYAALALTQAKIRARNEGSLEARAALDAAQLEYDATPAGIKELERRIGQQKGNSKTEYEMRLDLGKAKRAERLLLVKAKDRGDIKHLNSEQNTDVMFPASFHRFSKDYEQEEPIRYDSSVMKRVVEDSHNWVNKLNHDEIEAVSWYTSNGSFVINKHLTGNSDEFYLTDYRDDETAEEFDEREAKAAQAHLEHLNTTVKTLDSALAKGKRETPVKVYRGVSYDVVKADGYSFGEAARYVTDKFPVGSTYISPVFMSSSLEYKRGAGFESSGVLLEVLGKTVGPVSNVSAWGVAEKEYILPRNVAYKVRAVKKTQDKQGNDQFIVQLEEE